MDNHTFIDTDLQIHRLSPNPAVQKAAEYEFANSHPTALSAFSLVELKGNYISCLILLHRKVSDSDSFNHAYARIEKTGGRREKLMLAQLIKWLGGINFPINPWKDARRILLTHLDAQIAASWEEFRNSTDTIFDDFNCSRAGEAPQQIGDNWSATIPRCRNENTNCDIINFIKKFHRELKYLVDTIDSLDSSQITDELFQIRNISNETLRNNNQFPWSGYTCRRVADLLIGLQSKSGRELLSSNYKEHGVMHKPLGYSFRMFPIVKIRSTL